MSKIFVCFQFIHLIASLSVQIHKTLKYYSIFTIFNILFILTIINSNNYYFYITSVVLFCLAAVIFPVGFHVEEIGGQPYQLPNSFQV